MRELKFRAWDKENKKMYDVELIGENILKLVGAEWENRETFEVMQFTGKKVKTGEVFEGDIGKSIDGIFLVVWDEEKCAFMMQFYDYPNERLYLEEIWDDSEVIGNIYENPELLIKQNPLNPLDSNGSLISAIYTGGRNVIQT